VKRERRKEYRNSPKGDSQKVWQSEKWDVKQLKKGWQSNKRDNQKRAVAEEGWHPRKGETVEKVWQSSLRVSVLEVWQSKKGNNQRMVTIKEGCHKSKKGDNQSSVTVKQ
jgi:hypothetical protein